ncbi:hypothetical protein ACUZX0_02285 [Serratia marcescens]|uniref:hypothetical protein n=1 Tax=Serratia TaxID=613 RepID=UPI000894091F|nr:hypothetical protein [Serratia marcescens]MBM1296108.1 hypothetical protein [Serratia nematodiphila]MBH2572262.1 hypothetical protein [Serratia marcescens]MBH2610470.1 hypothetical protein [Serratia marcescens]MBH2929173.1 hypothetical protein [Serratia marcescens]MBH2940156.1 hypothetical protein [Serratia marcescens]
MNEQLSQLKMMLPGYLEAWREGALPPGWGQVANPEVVAALLAEWEALSELASRFETATEAPSEPAAFWQARAELMAQRNRELMAQLATPIRLPSARVAFFGYVKTAVMDARQVKAAIRDAGFIVAGGAPNENTA